MTLSRRHLLVSLPALAAARPARADDTRDADLLRLVDEWFAAADGAPSYPCSGGRNGDIAAFSEALKPWDAARNRRWDAELQIYATTAKTTAGLAAKARIAVTKDVLGGCMSPHRMAESLALDILALTKQGGDV